MSQWPKPENTIIPEGHYQFRLNREPEFRKFPYHDKTGAEKEGSKIILYIRGIGDTGEFSHVEGIPVWDSRYAKLCEVLDVEHGRDILMAGSMFEADIKHEADKRDPTKVYARLYGIAKAGAPLGAEPDEPSDVPF